MTEATVRTSFTYHRCPAPAHEQVVERVVWRCHVSVG
jgi:hypothetical protein